MQNANILCSYPKTIHTDHIGLCICRGTVSSIPIASLTGGPLVGCRRDDGVPPFTPLIPPCPVSVYRKCNCRRWYRAHKPYPYPLSIRQICIGAKEWHAEDSLLCGEALLAGYFQYDMIRCKKTMNAAIDRYMNNYGVL